MEREKEIPIEAFGITKSPLDDYRGTGRIAKMKAAGKTVQPLPAPAPKPAPTKPIKSMKVLDIAGNEVEVFFTS